jgi:hypothetical protein
LKENGLRAALFEVFFLAVSVLLVSNMLSHLYSGIECTSRCIRYFDAFLKCSKHTSASKSGPISSYFEKSLLIHGSSIVFNLFRRIFWCIIENCNFLQFSGSWFKKFVPTVDQNIQSLMALFKNTKMNMRIRQLHLAIAQNVVTCIRWCRSGSEGTHCTCSFSGMAIAKGQRLLTLPRLIAALVRCSEFSPYDALAMIWPAFKGARDLPPALVRKLADFLLEALHLAEGEVKGTIAKMIHNRVDQIAVPEGS